MDRPIYILGIHDGHNATASLIADGKVIVAVQEERLTRRKNEVGYPRRAIEDCLRIAGIGGGDLDGVTYASLFMHKADYLENIEPWYLTGLAEQRIDAQKPTDYQRLIFEQRKTERIADVGRHIGVAADRVTFVEHHLAHLAAAYYTDFHPHTGQPVLGLTCDGAGDNLAATVSVCHGNALQRVSATSRHASLGKIYSRVTMLLGMKPWEHEYKVMGMAPYADPERSAAAAETLRSLIRLDEDNLQFVQCGELSTNYCYQHLRDCFERVRFDTIAGATQLFTEELLVAWVRAAIRKTGIPDVVCGGGVFMNVKANQAIAQLPELRSLYVVPSAGDESLAFGAALHRYYQQTGRTDHSDSTFEHLYLGGDYTREEEAAAVADCSSRCPIEVVAGGDVDAMVVDLLAKGQIVARCRGRMEWGARALGNRSLLAGADNLRITEQLNAKIKQRDFWMPFAPSIRAESSARYLHDPKDLHPHFMTLAFDGSAMASNDLAAAMHPRDHTLRPQVVTAAVNPQYHRLLSLFELSSGRGGLLNTSFNIHGEPIVYSPIDAIDVLMRSGLEYLALDNHIVRKRTAD